MKLTFKCPICDKQLVLVDEVNLAGETLFTYKCGHAFAKPIHEVSVDTLDLNAVDGSNKKARPYQAEGVEFILKSDFNCIIGDQMRLGKTPQSLLALKNSYTDRTPCLILVRSANLWQWIREYKVWCDSLPLGIYPIVGSKAWIPPGFSAYIISMDTFSKPATCKNCNHTNHIEQEFCQASVGKNGDRRKCGCLHYVSNSDSMVERLLAMDFKLVIVDEAHSFKNTDSNRSQALVNFLHTISQRKKLDKQPRSRCGIIMLTGTAIKNRAEEYFIPLNLVAPEKFSSLERFRRQWLEQDSKGRWSRIKHYYIDDFKKAIAPYVLRREKEDVFTDLPPLNRIFTIIEPDKDLYTKSYNKILDKMDEKLASKADPSYWDMAEDLMELRRICGMMKLSWTCDYLEASLMDSDNQKYAIGIHHKAVRDMLYLKLGGYENCLKLSGEDSAESKDWIMRSFESSRQRLLIINMLAGGVGMDFHYCDNILVLERQWSSADEEQFEFRFYNPDLAIKNRSTRVEYIIAKGTLDEWWYDMVEGKRNIFGETIANNWSIETDKTSFKQLMEQTVAGRL